VDSRSLKLPEKCPERTDLRVRARYINNLLPIDISWYFQILEDLAVYRFQEKTYVEFCRIVVLRVIESDVLYTDDFPIT
jgi:hypothetical protein